MDTIDRINIRLKKMTEYIDYVEEYQNVTADELKNNHKTEAIVLHYFQLACECVIDIANMLNSEYRMSPASDATESILIIGKYGVLDQDFAKKFSGIAGFRNVLVHEYVGVDFDKVVDHLARLPDFAEFARQVAKYLTK